jgi:cysteine desulfurase / selenocysteine lyase
VQDSIRPTEFGWSNVAAFNDYSSPDMRLRPDAGRYECGTLNTIGCFGLSAALEFILEVGPEEIVPVVQDLGDRVAAGVQAKGYEILGHRSAATGAGIVSFRKSGLESREIVFRLRARGIVAAERLGWIRVSPHFYVSPEEIDRMIAELP